MHKFEFFEMDDSLLVLILIPYPLIDYQGLHQTMLRFENVMLNNQCAYKE